MHGRYSKAVQVSLYESNWTDKKYPVTWQNMYDLN